MANKKMKVKKKLKLKRKTKILLFILLIFVIYHFVTFNYLKKESFFHINLYGKINNYIKEKKYNKCIADGITSENFDQNTINKKNELISYIDKNDILYYYHDKDYNYDIKRSETKSIYGASLIKLVTALYLIDNDIDLNETVKYLAKYKADYSKEMKKHNIGDDITLQKLMEYSITYSDNTAHYMIINYIGKENLKEYSKKLGAKVLLDGGDDFGYQTAEDMNIYLNRAFELFTEKENGKLLKEYMSNTDTNALNFNDTISFLHKYGSYMKYFHDIGIYLGEHPYSIVVLTTKTEENGPSYVRKVSELTYNFHKAYYDNLETYCNNLVYNENN